MKKRKLTPTPESYKFVLTHSRFYEYENNKWYILSSAVIYLIAIQTIGRYVLNHNYALIVQCAVMVLFIVALVFANDYIFYRIARQNNKQPKK